MPRHKVSIPVSDGAMLSGVIDRPAGIPRAWALFAHCFTCGKSLPSATTVAARLSAAGIGVLRFDFTGLGDSDGDFADSNFSSNIDDLVCAAGWLREHHGVPALLVGHSLGGAAVLAAAHRIPDARAVVTIGAPSDPAHVVHLFDAHADRIRDEGLAQVMLSGRPFTIRQQLLDDIAEASIEAAVMKLGKALLVMHAPRDDTVGIDNAGAIFGWARHPKSFMSLDSADHLLRKRSDAVYVGAAIVAWADRYLPAGTDNAGVEVTATGAGKFEQSIATGRHHLIADEPVSIGGLDSGPGPYPLLLSALGACTAMTLRLYADRKGLALRDVSVTLDHVREPAEVVDGVTRPRAERIERAIVLDGDLDAATRARLLEIADHCPVHTTLTGDLTITTRLAD